MTSRPTDSNRATGWEGGGRLGSAWSCGETGQPRKRTRTERTHEGKSDSERPDWRPDRPEGSPGIDFLWNSPSAMTPKTLLHAMCKRHGLSVENGQSLLPLVQKALRSPTELRNRILFLVDGSLAERARGIESEQGLLNQLDDDVLKAVARVMHTWSPSGDVLDMGGLMPEGENPDT